MIDGSCGASPVTLKPAADAAPARAMHPGSLIDGVVVSLSCTFVLHLK